MKGSFCCFNRLMVMSISVSIWILSAFITSAVCEEDYHTINTTNTSQFTVYIPVTNLNLTEVSHLRFKVKACNDAHLNLLPTNVNNTYEIVIGGWSNNKSVIRQYNKNTGVKHDTAAPGLTFGYLDCNSFRPFWISWDGGHIKVGRGNQVGNSSTVFMNWLDPSPYPIATVSVSTGWGSTGRWQIYGPLNTLSTTAANYGPTISAKNTTPKPDLQPDFTVILGLAGGAVFIIIMVIIIACYCTRCKNRRRPLSLQTDSQKTPSNASMIYRNLIENVNNSSTKNPPTTSRSSDDLLQETITDERENSFKTIEKNKKEVNYNEYTKDSSNGNITSDKTESTSGTMEKNKKKIALLPLNIRPKHSSNDLSKENIKSEEIDASNALTEVQSPATPNTPDTSSYEYVDIDPKAEPLGPRNITHSYITVHSENHENVDPKSQSLELSDNTNEYLTIYTDEQAEATKKRQGGDKTNYMSPPNQSTKGEARNYYNTENRNGELVDVYISPANDGYYSNGVPQNTYYNEGQQPNVEHYTNTKLEPVDADYYNAIDPHDKETSEQPGYYNISETQQSDYYNTENENQQGNTQQDYYNDMKTEQPGYYNCDGIKTEGRPNSDVCEDYDYCDVDKPTSLIKA